MRCHWLVIGLSVSCYYVCSKKRKSSRVWIGLSASNIAYYLDYISSSCEQHYFYHNFIRDNLMEGAVLICFLSLVFMPVYIFSLLRRVMNPKLRKSQASSGFGRKNRRKKRNLSPLPLQEPRIVLKHVLFCSLIYIARCSSNNYVSWCQTFMKL